MGWWAEAYSRLKKKGRIVGSEEVLFLGEALAEHACYPAELGAKAVSWLEGVWKEMTPQRSKA